MQSKVGAIDEWFSKRRGEVVSVCALLLATLLAKGSAFLPGYSIDDYLTATSGPGADIFTDVLIKGRFGHWLLLKAIVALQLEPNGARIFFVAFAIAAFAALGFATVRFWNAGSNGVISTVVAIVIANHPYTSEIFTFRIGLAPAAVVMALLAFILLLISRGHAWLPWGTVAFAFALSVYPIALHFALMIVVMGLAIEVAREGLAAAPTDDTGESARGNTWRGILTGPSARLLAVLASGMIVYLVLGTVLRKVLGLRGEYFAFLQVSELPERFFTGFTFAVDSFFKKNLLIPAVVRFSFIAVVVFGLIVLLWQLFVRRRWRGAPIWGVVACLVCIGLWWTIGLSLILRIYWPVPRNMAHAGIFWGGCLLLVSLTVHSVPLRRLCAIVAIVAAISFIGSSQQIFDDQFRINVRDAQLANRLIARLERQPHFSSVRRVAVVGNLPWYPDGPFRTQWGDMNISGFGAFWSQVPVLREVSGYDLRATPDEAEKASAQNYCAGRAPWPEDESVTVVGELAIICLSGP